MASVSMIAPAIHCEGCASAIKRSLGKLSGVQEVSVGVADRSVSVTFDPAQVTPDAIKARLEQAGFPVQSEGV